jgi:uncharacterized protein YjbI with pentapeptide repeats
MANQSHLNILVQGVEDWNSWKQRNLSIRPDLSGANLQGANLSRASLSGTNLQEANLSRADLSGASFTNQHGAHIYGPYGSDLSRANLQEADLHRASLSKARLLGANLHRANLHRAYLSGAYLSGAYLQEANLSEAHIFGSDLSRADLSGANLSGAHLSEANLHGANLHGANLSGAQLHWAKLQEANLSEADLSRANLNWAILYAVDLSMADLSGADLSYSVLVGTNLERTTLEGCSIYGISAWNLKLEGAKQQNLKVSASEGPAIRVDNLEVAQFIYLLLNNEKIRQVIDTITSKVVLILGRFTPERKAVLDAIRDSLRQRDYLPVLFDFDKPASRDLTESISTLAHMARFIIADITHAKSIPQELQAIVPNLPSVPVQPLLLTSESEYGMFEHFRRYPWVLDTYYYDNLNEVLASVEDNVISPAETKARELSS